MRHTPRTTAYRFNEGDLIRTYSDESVYVIRGGAKISIYGADAFLRMGYQWSWIKFQADGSLDAVPEMPDDGTMLREQSDLTCYVSKAGLLHPIATEQVVMRYGGWARIAFVPDGSLRALPRGEVYY